MKTLLYLAFFVFPAVLRGQLPLRIEPVFHNYSVDQGLPNNWVYHITQDRKGYVWIATNSGVCRFNGYEFKQFPDTLNSNYTSVLGRCMAEDADGRMWFVDFQHRLFYIENERIIPSEYNNNLARVSPDVIYYQGLLVKGRGEEIWMGGLTKGLLHIVEQEDSIYIHKQSPAFINIVENTSGWLHFVRSGQLYVDVLKGKIDLISFNGKRVYLPHLPLDSEDFGLYSVNRLVNGHYILTIGSNLYCLKDGKLVWRSTQSSNKKAVIWVIMDTEGRVFTGHHYGGGLTMYASFDDLRTNRVALNLLQGLTVSCIMQDREGGYWIGTQERGVFYCPSFENGLLTGIPGLEQAVVKGVVGDSKSTLYAGYFNGKIYAIDLNNFSARDISWPETKLIHRLSYDEVSQTLVLAGNDNNLYRAGHWIAGFAIASNPKVPWRGRKVIPARQPDRWLSASGMGLLYLNLQTKQYEKSTYDLGESHYDQYYNSICQDQSGRIWAADRFGLTEWTDDGIVRAGTAYAPLRERISDIGLLPDTSLVLSPVGHGVVFWKPGQPPTEINSKQGLLSNEVTGLYFGAANTIWACTNRGVNKLIADGFGGYWVESYSTSQGLPSNNINAVYAIGDSVWLATGRGLFLMAKQPEVIAMAPPVFTSVSVGNTPYFPGEQLTLPHDSSDISLEFVALHFRSKGRILYEYRLLESSGDTVWRQSFDRQVSYPNLLPGEYRFEVKARSETGAWSPVTVLQIVIRPPWYATWWARLAGIAAIGLIIFGGYRYRVNQIQRENGLREEMQRLKQAALQAQMNPHFIFNCLNSIQHFILKNDAEEAVLYLSKFAKLVRGTLNASVAGKISLEEEILMLNNYLALEKLRFRQQFDFDISADERLSKSNTLLPPLILQPFVENAVLHGMKGKESGGRIEVRFLLQDGLLRVEVKDNGPGRAIEEKIGSLGSKITARRIELLKQQFGQDNITVVYDSPKNGVGTIAIVQLPIIEAQ